MYRIVRRASLILLAAAIGAGCLPTQEQANQSQDGSTSDNQSTLSTSTDRSIAVARPRDPVRTGRQVFRLEFYQLVLPQGSISSNAEFWKPFDETFLGFDVHEQLHRNGIRAGRAPLNELTALLRLLEDAETTESQLVGSVVKDFEMSVRTGVTQQTVNIFDLAGRQEMRDFERCANYFAVGFRQVPRQPDHVRLTIAPAVRTETPRLSMDFNTGGMRVDRPVTLYDVGIGSDLGVDECLVLSPSDEALRISMSIGRQFMMEDRPSLRVEKVLVIVPRLRGTLEEVLPMGRRN